MHNSRLQRSFEKLLLITKISFPFIILSEWRWKFSALNFMNVWMKKISFECHSWRGRIASSLRFTIQHKMIFYNSPPQAPTDPPPPILMFLIHEFVKWWESLWFRDYFKRGFFAKRISSSFFSSPYNLCDSKNDFHPSAKIFKLWY